MKEAITPTEYKVFQEAYDFFNRELFGDKLPHVLVTFQRRARTRGYFSAERFNNRVEEVKVHELAMNPDTFTDRTDEEILSTFVHEMVHVWQHVYGAHPPSRGYHNKEWASKMDSIGLCPSQTGEPGGKRTGQHVTHYIVASGPYAQAYGKLAATGFELHWQSVAVEKERDKSKTKFTCPLCGFNSWHKPTKDDDCHECTAREGKQIRMLASEG